MSRLAQAKKNSSTSIRGQAERLTQALSNSSKLDDYISPRDGVGQVAQLTRSRPPLPCFGKHCELDLVPTQQLKNGWLLKSDSITDSYADLCFDFPPQELRQSGDISTGVADGRASSNHPVGDTIVETQADTQHDAAKHLLELCVSPDKRTDDVKVLPIDGSQEVGNGDPCSKPEDEEEEEIVEALIKIRAHLLTASDPDLLAAVATIEGTNPVAIAMGPLPLCSPPAMPAVPENHEVEGRSLSLNGYAGTADNQDECTAPCPSKADINTQQDTAHMASSQETRVCRSKLGSASPHTKQVCWMHGTR